MHFENKTKMNILSTTFAFLVVCSLYCNVGVSAKDVRKVGKVDNKKFFISTNGLYNFDEGIAFCARHGGRVAEPRSMAQEKFLFAWLNKHHDLVPGSVHLGGTRRGKSHGKSNFYWLSDLKQIGGNGAFSNWNGGEPNNRPPGEECLHYYYNFLWNDFPCERKQFVLCEEVKEKESGSREESNEFERESREESNEFERESREESNERKRGPSRPRNG